MGTDSIAGLTKVCTKCGEEKAIELFTLTKRFLKGKVVICKSCKKAQFEKTRLRFHPKVKHQRRSEMEARYGIEVVEFMDEVGMTESRNDLDDFTHPDGRTFSGFTE